MGEFVVGVESFGGIHEFGAAAHVDANAENLCEFGAGAAEFHEFFHVEADAAVALTCDADGEGDVLFGFQVEDPIFIGRIGEGLEPLHDFGAFFAEFFHVVQNPICDFLIAFAHGFS